MRRYNPANKGFTLVEIMIVVAIIALLAAIAIPYLLRARLNANETAAIGAQRTESTAEETYRAAQTPPSYGTFAQLISATPPYLNMVETPTGTISRQGYDHAMTGTVNANQFCIQATPQVVNQTGSRSFCVDNSGVVRSYGAGQGCASLVCSGAALE